MKNHKNHEKPTWNHEKPWKTNLEPWKANLEPWKTTKKQPGTIKPWEPTWNQPGTKKSGHLDHPLQSYGQKYFNIFLYISAKAGWLWLATGLIKNKNCFVRDLHWTTSSLRSQWESTPEPPKKCFFRKFWFFGNLGFPLVILVNKPLKALCLSFKIVYQHLLYLLSLWIYCP